MKTLLEIIQSIHDSRTEKILNFHQQHFTLIYKAKGSSYNHHAWEGGYADHIAEVLSIAFIMYNSLKSYRQLDFSLESSLIVLYFHDVEKIWKYTIQEIIDKPTFYRETLKADYQIAFTPTELNALEFIHGEGNAYSNNQRIMSPLAAFCHAVDTISARIWFDQGKDCS